MGIILILMALGATPYGVALLADKPTKKRVAKFVDVHWLTPLEKKVKGPSLAPSVIPSNFTGALEKQDKNWDAEKKLKQLWQDAYNWFDTPDAVDILASALEIRANQQEILKPYKDSLIKALERQQGAALYGHFFNDVVAQYEDNFNDAQRRCLAKFNPIQQEVLKISDRYSWNLINNGIIRNIEKENLLFAVDPIAYAL